MSDPFVLAHLSDPHVGAQWVDGVDPVAGLAAVVEAVLAMPSHADAVLVSGDLAEHGADAEYEQVREVLGRFEVPVHVMPGNHDDRETLRRHFPVPGAGGEPVNYSVDLGKLRLVVVDTTIPEEEAGALDAAQLAWLDAELAAAPRVRTLVAMHHPPLVTGVALWDETGLPGPDRRALGEVMQRHAQVRRIVGGHVHRVVTADLAGRPVFTAPSTYLQARLDFGAEAFEVSADPAGFALHAVVDGEIVSHVQPVALTRSQ